MILEELPSIDKVKLASRSFANSVMHMDHGNAVYTIANMYTELYKQREENMRIIAFYEGKLDEIEGKSK